MKIRFITCIAINILFAHYSQSQSYVPLWNDSKMKVQPAATPETFAFPLSDVKLLEGPFSKRVGALYGGKNGKKIIQKKIPEN